MKTQTGFLKTVNTLPRSKRSYYRQFNRALRLEPLEQRRLLSVDLEMLDFDVDPESYDLRVTYLIHDEISPEFAIGRNGVRNR